ncbi:MAG TPA: MoaD/ThiS family protein [Thermodesulfobacteriota bacterium]|nr:MoaD/ThiS family protein [Thermodesulfobacteriota bacterium]
MSGKERRSATYGIDLNIESQGGENLRILFSINGEHVEEGGELKEGDEVPFIPPVSGG